MPCPAPVAARVSEVAQRGDVRGLVEHQQQRQVERRIPLDASAGERDLRDTDNPQQHPRRAKREDQQRGAGDDAGEAFVPLGPCRVGRFHRDPCRLLDHIAGGTGSWPATCRTRSLPADCFAS